MMIKIAVECGDPRCHQQNYYQRVAEPAQEFERQRQTAPLFQRIGTVTQSTQCGLRRGKAFRVGSKLALKIGERDLPKVPLGPAIGFHCNPSIV
jgi:hypothetical protein